MRHYCNLPENFIRELKGVLIYDKSKISYIDQYNNIFPQPEDALYKFRILPADPDRKIPTKLNEDNVSYSLDIVLSLVDLSIKNREEWYSKFNKFRKFAIVLVSNSEMVMIGNERYPMSITVTDNIKDDGSGNDSFGMNIYGDTIISPKMYKIAEKFKVLFFLPRLI
ncbi:hypothetical protein CMU51_00115 [Elizabethkingia anophelis]|uniref:Uncharacterized protein n=1 Tax=Elizabethkingia anophelis TaxID=1117645 RepID=A0AAE4NY68_9FLAO|nr:hypothetical protein [Elizabethkingia anophelis]